TTSEDSPLPPGRELADALRWIRGSTPRGSRVLASPFIETFYQEAERAQLVSFKYIPQSEGDMLQWYERLKACNGGRDPRSAGFASRGEVEASFYGLSEDELRALAKRYGMSYYLGRQDHPKSLPALYSNAEYALYAL
ncbi:MAG TPA: DUF6798 domain-containing protein, partial [Elusimicrobiota bacterium]|nr:DUF6798 domain-containing protein [Elusimicrobiota bacterium]